jgi:hypothetical protein
MLTLSLITSLALADSLTVPETSYTGATILQGDTDVIFDTVLNSEYETSPEVYAFFEGNTLYVGNSDDYGNSVDAIVEFFWFQSSIDRGSDFYVAVIKVRATPGRDCPLWMGLDTDCELWADDLADWGEHPVVSVEAITDVSREQGAFRWDWAVPFENYGIDAYGQVSFTNQYGIGVSAEGAVMAHGEIPLDESGTVQAEGDVQVKGFFNPSFMVQTQYDVTLYEWDVYVNGRADLMAWDTYLNLGERANQSAYYEYFLPVQVEVDQSFVMDEFNFIANFDIGNFNPFTHELGLSLQGIEINPPFYEEHEEEVTEPSSEPSEEPSSEPEGQEPSEETEPSEEQPDGSTNGFELEGDSEPVKSCNNAGKKNDSQHGLILFALAGLVGFGRRR